MRSSAPLFFLAAIVASGLVRAQAPLTSLPTLTDEQMVAAEARYQRYCSLCHGADRQGHVNDHAPSLKSKSLLASGFPRTLREAIAYGRPGTPMGGYLDEIGGPMTLPEVRELALWLATVEKVEPFSVTHDPVAGDAALGARVYAENCASCHGANGEGGTGTALGNPVMLGLTPDRFLRHAIAEGRDGTPMPAFKDTLSAGELDGVTAFLRSRSSGWKHEKPVLATPPPLDRIVLNPEAAAPDFTLADGLYVSAAELDRELKAGKKMVLLDTRVTSMWQMTHIAGAVPAPYYSSREEVLASLPADGTWIVAYCECPRAAAESVVRSLRESGVKNTAVLYEGIQGWITLGYPVVAGRASPGAAH
ncbi:c-type cytochrome [Arenimonas daejeonensis]|uniref:c-type cytochrome n=1 Tax=Arenimonas daejeonensis TaxID=370777 RepID=UPI00131583B6|nr:c-type cytochrome [Arenimonas daejeonensis]